MPDPIRDKLAATIERHRAAAAKVEELEAAASRALDQVLEARRELDQCIAADEHHHQPAQLVSALLLEDRNAVAHDYDVTQALAAHRRAVATREALDQAIEEALRDLRDAALARDEAVFAVIGADPAVPALIAARTDLERRLNGMNAVLSLLQSRSVLREILPEAGIDTAPLTAFQDFAKRLETDATAELELLND
jgi:hypothetical protein